MRWTIGKHHIKLKVTSEGNSVSIDREPFKKIASIHAVGDFPLRIGERDGIIRLLRKHGLDRSELWLDGVCVPSSSDALVQKRARMSTLCAAAHPEDFRTAPAPAKYLCGTCSKPICAEHIAVDDVRCPTCFEAAVRADARAFGQHRDRDMAFGAGVGIVVTLGAAVAGNSTFIAIGLATTAIVTVQRAIIYLQERKEARRRDGD